MLSAARRRLERTGGELSGSVVLTAPTEAERRLLIGITGQHRPPGVKSVRVSLVDLDAAMYDEFGLSLSAVLARLNGPMRNRPAEAADEERARSESVAEALRRAGRNADEHWYAHWLEQLGADGTLTRLVRRGDGDQLAWAADVLARLPAPVPVSLPVLAERTTGHTKALSGTVLSALVLRALAFRVDDVAPTDAAGRRALWESVGVIVDDLASQVLVLGVKAREDHVVAEWLHDAADFGIPFRLTLHQLSTDSLTITAKHVFVCENPAVLRAAASSSPDEQRYPLICTEGQPSAACHRLLTQVKGRIHWRGDFDWTGLRTTAMAIDRYGAVPWRMTTDEYLAAFDNALPETEPLKGAPANSPWDPPLAVEMAGRGRAIMEERLIPQLLSDLRRPA